MHLTRLSLFILLLMSSAHIIHSQDWPNLKRYQHENDSLKKEIRRVVFMGNSITEGWKSVQPDFFKKFPFINRGIGGQTTPQMLVRFRQDVIDLNPDVVVILAGTNDIAGNTGPATEKMIIDNLKTMAEVADYHGIQVVLCSILPVSDYPWSPGLNPGPKIVSINKALREYSTKHGHVYCDYHSAMVDDKLGMKQEYTYDGVHATEQGYTLMESIILEKLGLASEK